VLATGNVRICACMDMPREKLPKSNPNPVKPKKLPYTESVILP